MKRILAAVALLAASAHASAGWYEVKNYEGAIGPHAVHVSIQTFKSLHENRVSGSYYYDSRRIPIALHGTERPDGTLVLCEAREIRTMIEYTPNSEAIRRKDPCPLLLTATPAGMTGKWQSATSNLEVSLKTVGTIDNNQDDVLIGKVDVPMWTNSVKYLYVGSYEMYRERLIMRSVRAVNIATGQIDKIADLACKPSDDGCEPGLLYTDIYMNVSETGPSRISIGYGGPKMGSDEEVTLRSVKPQPRAHHGRRAP